MATWSAADIMPRRCPLALSPRTRNPEHVPHRQHPPPCCRARQLFAYMKNYNYEVKSTGEVITFEGNYRSTRGQAAAITFYMFVGMLCCGLVLSIAAPGGNLWYGLTALTPVAPWYYYQNADRCVSAPRVCLGSISKRLVWLTPVAPWYYYQNADRCVSVFWMPSPGAVVLLPERRPVRFGASRVFRLHLNAPGVGDTRRVCPHVYHLTVFHWFVTSFGAVQRGGAEHQDGDGGRRQHD